MSELKKTAVVAKAAELLRSDKGRKWLLLCGVVGIVLLALPEFLPDTQAASKTTATASIEEFVRQTEERLGAIVSSIEGAGECRIMVTLVNGVEYVYATEQSTNTDRQEDSDESSSKIVQRDDVEETVIVVDTGSGREGLLVTEIQPTVQGVVVVCAGGDNEEVRERIVQAVTVALNISSKRVCVTKLS